MLKKYLEAVHGNEIKNISIRGGELDNKNASNIEKKNMDVTNVDPDQFADQLKAYFNNLQGDGQFTISMSHNDKAIVVQCVMKASKIVFAKSEELGLQLKNKSQDEFINELKNKLGLVTTQPTETPAEQPEQPEQQPKEGNFEPVQ